MTEFQKKSTRRQYIKSKLVVKKWEDDFSVKNGRLPTRADIKLAPAKVRESYNQYYKIKTELLASQILTEDENNLEDFLDKSFGDLSQSTNLTEIIKNSSSDKNEILSIDKDVEVDKCAPHVEKIDPKTWGSNLNVKKVNLNSKGKHTSISALSQKLFKGSTFNKRNPRKVRSFKETKSVNSDKQNPGFVNSQETESNSSVYSNLSSSLTDDTIITKPVLNEQNECFSNGKSLMETSVSLLPTNSILSKSENFIISEEKVLSNVQKVSLIQEISRSSSISTKTLQSFHEGWLERCMDMTAIQQPQRNSDSGFYSMENSLLVPDSKEESEVEKTSDDDFINDSDHECNENSRTSFTPLSQKRKSDVLNSNVVEKADHGIADDVSSTCKEITTHKSKKIKIDLNEVIENIENSKLKSKENTKTSNLEKKIKSNSLNENYVKLNLEKKVYVRGKKKFNFSKYKKQQWKKDKKMLDNDRENTSQCYKCGESGHFSYRCKKGFEDKLLEVDDECEDEDDPLLTLEEAQALAQEKANRNFNFKSKGFFTVEKPPEEISNQTEVKGLYQLDEGGSVMKTPPEVQEALEKFGHSKFRPGQEEAIMRILSGLSTLLIISTGGGKSLCYQLPAYLYAKRSNCITLVISPLVSLMEDQVSGSFSFFKAGCLHTNQTEKQREIVLEEAKSGKLHALLVSPEAVVSGNSSKGFGGIFKQLPPIAFACIDEVHCLSQWSHNFRPSYLLINRVLKNKFGVTTVLGLTATASPSTIKSITEELEISEERDVIKNIPIPHNLYLSVSKDENREEALIGLLKSPQFKDFQSVLVYCSRRADCERLAVLIRTVLQDSISSSSQEKSKRLSWIAESYHAGMAAARRKQVQRAFMKGNLRIVVATVAFGMGINKQDIRAVIHYNMPKDFESYVQELGRAGRDGMPARCHVFLDSRGQDLSELRRHIYSNSVDRFALRKLLEKVFIKCDCVKKNERSCEGHEVAFDCQKLIESLDIPEENIQTLLCYLELHEKKFIKVLAPAYVNCKIQSYKGIKQINAAAKKCPPLAYVCALNAQLKKKSNPMEFDVVQIARQIGWDSSLVKSHLKNLEWEMSPNSTWKKTGISVEFFDLGFRILSRGDVSLSEQDEALDYLMRRVENQEKRSLALLNLTFGTLDRFACNKYAEVLDGFDENKSNELKKEIRNYFENEIAEEILLKNQQEEEFDEEIVASDVRSLICTYRDNTFNARSVARIFHGISSPNYPASIWYKCRFWRRHLDKDFNKIIEAAKREILRFKL